MLLSSIITLQPRRRVTLSVDLGRAVHAWFLDRLGEADPALTTRLHEPNLPRPFTISSLRGVGQAEQGQVTLSPAQEYWVRVTSLEETLSRCLLEEVLPHLPSEMRLAEADLTIKGWTCDPQAHPWAGQTTYQTLVEERMLGEGRAARTFTLRFSSPTTFRRTGGESSLADSEGRAYRVAGHNLPLPLPGLVWDSYLRRWNEFAPVALPAEVKRYAEECVTISRYRLQTVLVEFGRAREVGFTGVCRFTALVYDPYWLRLLDLLASFAFYSGTGRHTTRGLGQTRRVG